MIVSTLYSYDGKLKEIRRDLEAMLSIHFDDQNQVLYIDHNSKTRVTCIQL
jgi:hypothetical protein